MKKIVLMSLMVFVCILGFADNITVEPKGIYAKIDTKLDIKAIQIFQTGLDEEKEQAANDIIKNSGKYCPATFFSLADYLCSKGKTDDAIFWLFAGRIRTRYDIFRSADQTVEDTISELNMNISDFLRLVQFENLEKTKEIVNKAIEWDKKTPHDYDPKWIALHGMGAFMPEAEKATEESLLAPKNTWNSLAEENRKKYQEGTLSDIASITPEQLKQIQQTLKELRQEKQYKSVQD